MNNYNSLTKEHIIDIFKAYHMNYENMFSTYENFLKKYIDLDIDFKNECLMCFNGKINKMPIYVENEDYNYYYAITNPDKCYFDSINFTSKFVDDEIGFKFCYYNDDPIVCFLFYKIKNVLFIYDTGTKTIFCAEDLEHILGEEYIYSKSFENDLKFSEFINEIKENLIFM